MSLPLKVAHPDLKCYLRPSLSDRVSALKKSLLTNTKIKLKQEKFVPPHPAVISREKQKNKKHRRRPITPKEMNKITTVFFYIQYTKQDLEALWTGVIFYTNL